MLGTCQVPSLLAQGRDPKDLQPNTAPLGVINDIDVAVTDLTEEKLNNPPKREIKFERLTEPLKRQLPKPDPKLLEQKYVASIRLVIPPKGENFAAFLRDEEGNVPQVSVIGGSLLLSPSNGGWPDSTAPFLPMIKSLPTHDSPANEERAFFANPENTGQMMHFRWEMEPGTRAPRATWIFTILGTTPELVELRAAALLTLMDQGASRPLQLAILKKRDPLCVQLRDQRKAAESAQRAISAVNEVLKSFVDFTPDMLSNLRVQQLQLEVDLAGVKARIAACDRLLAGATLKPERRSQVEDVKVAAEIEFSGYEARLTKSNEFIGKVKTKVELLGKLSSVEVEQKRARSKIQSLEQQIKNIDAAIHAYAPLSLVDNKVTIQPLEWTQ